MSNVGSAAGGYRVENPATGEVVEKFDYATDEQIDQVLDAAHKGYLSWRDKTIEERAAIVNKVAALFGERKIGRASCRERVWISVGGVSLQERRETVERGEQQSREHERERAT